MPKRALALLAALLLLPVLGYSKPRHPAETHVLDLAGVPKVHANAPLVSSHRMRIKVPGKVPGWVVSLMRTRSPRLRAALSRFRVAPSAAYQNGRVFVGGGLQSTKLVALDARTGRRVWSAPLHDNGPSAVVITRGRTITNTESCSTYSVDPGTGKVQWSRTLGPSILTPPAVVGDQVFATYVAGKGGTEVTALDLKTGRPDWASPVPGHTVGAPVVALGRVFLTLTNGQAVCLSRKTGGIYWKRNIGATSAPVLGADGLYYAAVKDGRPGLVCIAPASGSTLWRAGSAGPVRKPSKAPPHDVVTRAGPPRSFVTTPAGWAADPPRPVVAEPWVVLAAGQDLVAFDSGTGEVAFRLRMPGEHRFSAPPAVLGKDLLYATNDGLLVEIDLELRCVRRAVDLGLPVTSQPIFGGGRVFVTSGDRVVAVPWGDRKNKIPDYPQWGGSL